MLRSYQRMNILVHEILSKKKQGNIIVKDGEPKSQKLQSKRKKSLKLMELLCHKKIKRDWIEGEKPKKRKN